MLSMYVKHLSQVPALVVLFTCFAKIPISIPLKSETVFCEAVFGTVLVPGTGVQP